MSEPDPPRDPLAVAALGMGFITVLVTVVGIAFSSGADGEAGISAVFLAGIVIAVVAAAGTVVGIVAVARKAQPRRSAVIGLVLSAIPLALALLPLIALLEFAARSSNY